MQAAYMKSTEHTAVNMSVEGKTKVVFVVWYFKAKHQFNRV